MPEDQRSPKTENSNAELPSGEPSRSTSAEKPEENSRAHRVNPDSEGLGWYGNDRIVIGCVDEVNGPGSIEFPSYVPTRHELIQLAKYWAGVEIDLDFSWFVCQQTGSSEIRLGPFARRRMSRIAEVLAEGEVTRAVNEAYDEFGKGCDPRTWEIFREGTPEERQALQEEIAREMAGIENPEKIARITEFMESLRLDSLAAESGKAQRFAILPSQAAAVSDPACIIVVVLHYVNAAAGDGRYRKNDDGTVPPIEWELRHLGLSPLEVKHIQRLSDPGQAVNDIDIIMLGPDPASGREFSRASNTARWRKNPQLAAEGKKSAVEASNVLAAKVAGRNGVTLFEDFQSASTGIDQGQSI